MKIDCGKPAIFNGFGYTMFCRYKVAYLDFGLGPNKGAYLGLGLHKVALPQQY
jgi:hypothetical protein